MRSGISIFVAITVLFVSCEGEPSFSIDRCVGEYICRVNGQTLLVLPSGRKEHPPVPLTNYPKEIRITVERTGENELTLTIEGQTLVARIDPEGKLTLPNMEVLLENKYYHMPLNASYTAAYITPQLLFIKQVATGVASCDDRGDRFTLTATNTQFIEGEKQ